MNRKLNNGFLIYLISFVFPVMLMSIVFMSHNIYPFGNKIALVTDLYHQYTHYYSYFIDSIKGNGSFLYSWYAGLGSNFIGNIAYYTASPLLLILTIFPNRLLSEGILIIIIIKIGLCGVSANYFIRKKFTKLNKYESILFSSFYALMSYNVTYYYSLMWLDGVILFPLIILSLDSILNNKGLTSYVILLTTLFITNFYISYMVGTFIFIYFLIDILILKTRKSSEEIKSIIYRFVKGTLLSIGISSFLLVPTFFQILRSLGYGKEILRNNLSINFILKLLGGVFDSVINGSPNIYIGTFVIILVPIFFTSKINRHEKIKWGTLLLIMFASFIFPPLNLLWHAGDVPTWFPYRYSFIFSFVLFYISLRGYEVVKSVRIKKIVFVLVLNIFLLTIVWFTNKEVFILDLNIYMILLFFIIILLKKYNFKNTRIIMFFIFTTMELFFNTSIIITELYGEIGLPSRDQYAIYSKYSEAISKIQEYDLGLYYRVETDVNKTNNDSLKLRHSSFSHSSSMLSNDLINTMGALGFYARKANYNKSGRTIFTDSILGLKYFVSSSKLSDDNFKEISRVKDLIIYKNNSYLPIGYETNKDIKNIAVLSYKDLFKLQNDIYKSMFKNKDVLFTPIHPEEIEYLNADVRDLDKGKKLIRLKEKEAITVKYLFDINDKITFYALLNLPTSKDIKIYINSQKISSYEVNNLQSILKVGSFNDQKVEIKIKFDRGYVEFTSDELFYIITDDNMRNFKKNIENINRKTFIITELKENKMKAKVSIKQDDALLFMSIPWDRGWRITVNKRPVKPIKVLSSFVGIPVKKGDFQLEIEFIPEGFLLGSIISLISILIFLIGSLVRINKLRKETKND